MNARGLKWTAAIVVSLGLHTAAGGFAVSRFPEAEVAGGSTTEFAIAGDAFADQVASGETLETVAPVSQDAPETVQPDTTAEIAPEAPATPVQSDVAEVAPTVTAQETAIPQPADTPEQPVEQAETVMPVEQSEMVVAALDAPLPTPRPAYTPPKKPKTAKQPAPRETRKAARNTRKPPSSGSRGRDEQDARRGSATGSRDAGETARGRQTARASQSGNARVSNYPGKIIAKLRRARRYPSEAKRERLRGQVRISFTVTSGGGVSSIRVLRSSGSPILDRAALDTVRRAAPFPPIPQEARRSTWPFDVPLDFSMR